MAKETSIKITSASEHTEHTARFLGQSYTTRRPVKTVNSQLGVRKYRGVAYSA